MSGYGGILGGRSGPERDDHGDAHVYEIQVQPIVVCRSEAAAEFIAATLATHGVQAQTRAYFHAYPSVDWVEGYSVSVQLEDEARARQLLADLSRDDAVLLDDD